MELKNRIGFAIDSGVALITLSGNATGNALAPAQIRELAQAFRKGFSASEVRVLMLRATGKTFCSGMDLSKLAEAGEPDERLLKEAIGDFSALLRLIATGPKPIIAAVTGDLLAGGVGLAGACDLVYGIQGVRVQLGEGIFGLIPANIMPVLVGRRISAAWFRRLAMTAEAVDAEVAHTEGLFDGLYPNREALEKALRRVLKQLLRVSPEATARLKMLMAMQSGSAPSIHRYAQSTLYDLAASPATLEAIRSVQNGDTPSWFSKFRPKGAVVLDE